MPAAGPAAGPNQLGDRVLRLVLIIAAVGAAILVLRAAGAFLVLAAIGLIALDVVVLFATRARDLRARFGALVRGLEPDGRREIPETLDHFGSTVVLCRR